MFENAVTLSDEILATSLECFSVNFSETIFFLKF